MTQENETEVDDDFFEEDEDEYEDHPALQKILADLPDGWALVRVMAGWNVLAGMREWLTENCTGEYREVNWANGGCSYSTGVMLETDMDAILFKLRWG